MNLATYNLSSGDPPEWVVVYKYMYSHSNFKVYLHQYWNIWIIIKTNREKQVADVIDNSYIPVYSGIDKR